jgi:hypothetical protein
MNIHINPTGIMGGQATPAQSQEEIQRQLLKQGENRVQPPQMPSAPADILGYPSSILGQPESAPAPAPSGDVEPPQESYTPEHEAAGAVPADDDITVG